MSSEESRFGEISLMRGHSRGEVEIWEYNMSQKSGVCLLAIILAVFVGKGSLLGEEEPSQAPGEFQGQAELDRATRLRVSAKTMGQLEEVVAACERALELGLDKGNRVYATQLMTATLLEHSGTP